MGQEFFACPFLSYAVIRDKIKPSARENNRGIVSAHAGTNHLKRKNMNDKQRNIGIGVAISGLLLLCCICPLALNSWLLTLTSSANPRDAISIYGRLFTTPIGNLSLASYVSGLQLLCASVLALVVLVLGVVAFMQARKAS